MKKYPLISRLGAVLVAASFILSPASAGAATTSDLQAQINALIAQIQYLQTQLNAVNAAGSNTGFGVKPVITSMDIEKVPYDNQTMRVGWTSSALTGGALTVSCSRSVLLSDNMQESNDTIQCSRRAKTLESYVSRDNSAMSLTLKDNYATVTLTFVITLSNGESSKKSVTFGPADANSNGLFEITYPAGGEKFKQKSSYTLKWKGVETGVSSYDVALIKGGVNGGDNIVKSLGTVSASYPYLNWTVPTTIPIGSGYTISYVGTGPAGKHGGVSNSFSIVAGVDTTATGFGTTGGVATVPAAATLYEISAKGYSKNEVEAGQSAYMNCSGCSGANTLWIGYTGITANGTSDKDIAFVVPSTLTAGTYTAYFTTAAGAVSNSIVLKVYKLSASAGSAFGSNSAGSDSFFGSNSGSSFGSGTSGGSSASGSNSGTGTFFGSGVTGGSNGLSFGSTATLTVKSVSSAGDSQGLYAGESGYIVCAGCSSTASANTIWIGSVSVTATKATVATYYGASTDVTLKFTVPSSIAGGVYYNVSVTNTSGATSNTKSVKMHGLPGSSSWYW